MCNKKKIRIVSTNKSFSDHLWQRIHSCPPVERLYREALAVQRQCSISTPFIKLVLKNPNDPGRALHAHTDLLTGELVLNLEEQNENSLMRLVSNRVYNLSTKCYENKAILSSLSFEQHLGCHYRKACRLFLYQISSFAYENISKKI